MGDDHKDEGETHWKNSQWMAGIRDDFFPQDLAGSGNGTVLSLSQDCFSLLPLQHCKLHNHAMLWHSERSSSKFFLSTSAFPLGDLYTELYFISKLLGVLHTSKAREIIQNTSVLNGSVGADENSEMQTKPLGCGFFHCVEQGQCCCSH